MKHNINELSFDHFKLNLLIEYYTNKRSDIIGIYETNKDKKHGEYWNNRT